MIYEVTNFSANEIKIIPESELEEISQNVRTIISTKKFTAPLDRGFGINAAFLDEPIAKSQVRLTAEIARAVKEFEPRARVTKIIFSGDHSAGELKFKVFFKIIGNKKS